MSRKHRVHHPFLTFHVVQRGTNKQTIFWHQQDANVFLNYLLTDCVRYGAIVHNYAVMSNHFHLLVTQVKRSALSKVMQNVGSRYVTFINKKYERVGALFQGRYFASVVQTESYLLNTMRYIENNPVRAGMARSLFSATNTSYRTTAHGKPSSLVIPHPHLCQYGADAEEQRRFYQEFCRQPVAEEELHQIRTAYRQRVAVGDRAFSESLEKLTGIRQHSILPGSAKGEKKKLYIIDSDDGKQDYSFESEERRTFEQELIFLHDQQAEAWYEIKRRPRLLVRNGDKKPAK
ncbi:MAG: transposase [Aliidiomarina sp.]|uniref:transposase n=1 Tax=Aliidiomarina sp. TaxID=1872439 RepID=UPI0025C1BE53|nr:transposase [Aliidiomarina sp.]MCH8502678.1 transposase [Aliidiomarina sp.]